MVASTTAVVSVAKFRKKSPSMYKRLLGAATSLIVKRNSIIKELDQLLGRSIFKAFPFFRVSEIHSESQFLSKFWKIPRKVSTTYLLLVKF